MSRHRGDRMPLFPRIDWSLVAVLVLLAAAVLVLALALHAGA